MVEVRPDKVTILADTAETPEDIDAARAQDALARAQQLLATNPPPHERPVVEAAVRRQQPAPQGRPPSSRPARHRGSALRQQVGSSKQAVAFLDSVYNLHGVFFVVLVFVLA